MILSFKKRCGTYRLMEDAKLRVTPDPNSQWDEGTRLFNKLMKQKAAVDPADPHLFILPRGTVIEIKKLVEHDWNTGPYMFISVPRKLNEKKHPWLSTSVLLRNRTLWGDVELDVEEVQ